MGTVQPNCPLRILRGQSDILRMIWIFACSEWWDLHIQQYQIPTMDLLQADDNDEQKIQTLDNNVVHINMMNMYARKVLMDCPLVVIQDHIQFPPIIKSQEAPLNINMMPFDLLFEPEQTLPEYLHGYIHIVKECRKYIKSFAQFEKGILKDSNNIKHRIAYITVDERPVSQKGKSQRREGVHVESPGAMRPKEVIDKGFYTPELGFYHRWGLGHSTGEYLVGGIFLVSNMANTLIRNAFTVTPTTIAA
jgi:hypothetical protein